MEERPNRSTYLKHEGRITWLRQFLIWLRADPERLAMLAGPDWSDAPLLWLGIDPASLSAEEAALELERKQADAARAETWAKLTATPVVLAQPPAPPPAVVERVESKPKPVFGVPAQPERRRKEVIVDAGLLFS